MTASVQATAEGIAVAGNMTVDTARSLLEGGRLAMTGKDTTIDLSRVAEVDSAALAILFGWQRDAKARGMSIRIANIPQGLSSLAEVYDVSELLPLA